VLPGYRERKQWLKVHGAAMDAPWQMDKGLALKRMDQHAAQAIFKLVPPSLIYAQCPNLTNTSHSTRMDSGREHAQASRCEAEAE
jgi:hypothetical protein